MQVCACACLMCAEHLYLFFLTLSFRNRPHITIPPTTNPTPPPLHPTCVGARNKNGKRWKIDCSPSPFEPILKRNMRMRAAKGFGQEFRQTMSDEDGEKKREIMEAIRRTLRLAAVNESMGDSIGNPVSTELKHFSGVTSLVVTQWPVCLRVTSICFVFCFFCFFFSLFCFVLWVGFFLFPPCPPSPNPPSPSIERLMTACLP